MLFSVHTVNLRLRQATSDGPNAVVRRLRFVLPPLHKPNASRIAQSNTNPSPRTLTSPSPIRPAWVAASLKPGTRQRDTRGRRERGVSEGSDGGAHQTRSGSRGRRERGASTGATSGGNRREEAAAGVESAAPARRRLRSMWWCCRAATVTRPSAPRRRGLCRPCRSTAAARQPARRLCAQRRPRQATAAGRPPHRHV